MILSEFSAVFSGNEEDDKYMSRMISRLPPRTYNDKQNQPACPDVGQQPRSDHEMKKLDFNSGWTFRKAEEPPAARPSPCPTMR